MGVLRLKVSGTELLHTKQPQADECFVFISLHCHALTKDVGIGVLLKDPCD